MSRIYQNITFVALIVGTSSAQASSKVCYDTNKHRVVPCARGWEEPAGESPEERVKREPWRSLAIWDELDGAYIAFMRSSEDLSENAIRRALKPLVLAHRD